MFEELNTTFFDYLTKMQNIQKSPSAKMQLDSILVVMYAQMMSINLAVVHGKGIWVTDENTNHDVTLVYKGSGNFSPIEQGMNHILVELSNNVKKTKYTIILVFCTI